MGLVHKISAILATIKPIPLLTQKNGVDIDRTHIIDC